MIPQSAKLRIARPTDNLEQITRMYIDGLGFVLLGAFEGHDGFDGSIIGHKQHNYHLEFTHHRGVVAGRAPTKDNLLVFYFAQPTEWSDACQQMMGAGFKLVESYNPYWDQLGKTFEDIDGYRVVLQNCEWTL